MTQPNPTGIGLDEQARWPSLSEDATRRLRLVEVPPPAVRLDDDQPEIEWFGDANRRRGETLFTKLERAVAKGATKRARRLRKDLCEVIHQDRVANACAIARTSHLHMEPVGWGDLLTEDITYRLRRSPWRVTGLRRGTFTDLPPRAATAKASWEAHGEIFDAYYLADELPDAVDPALGVPKAPESFLIGAISRDGRNADWFVLDRWTLMRVSA